MSAGKYLAADTLLLYNRSDIYEISFLTEEDMKKRTQSTPRIRSVRYNVIMNMILSSSTIIFPLVTVPYVSRVLQPYGTGAVAFTQSAMTYFSLVALLGVSSYGVRVCAVIRDDKVQLSKTVKELLIILICSTTLVTLVYLLCIYFIPQFRAQTELFLIFGIGLWLSAFGVEWLYQALEQYGYITIRNIVIKILCLIAMFVLVRRKSDYIVYGAIVVVAGYGANICNILRLRKLVDLSIKTKLKVSRHFKPMFHFFVASVSSGMYVQADTFILGLIGTTNMVGLYQLVVKIKSTLITVVNSVGNVMLPRLSYYNTHEKKGEAGLLVAKTLNFAYLFSLVLVCWCALERNGIIYILGGPEYAAAATALVLIAPSIALSSLNSTLGYYMASVNKEKLWATINVVGLICAIIFNIVLIHFFGIIGAAISCVLCELSVFIMRTFNNRVFLRSITKHLEILKTTICIAVSAVVTYFISKYIFVDNILLNFLDNSVIYFSIVLLSLIVGKEYFTRQIVRKIIKKVTK